MKRRDWVPTLCENHVQAHAENTAQRTPSQNLSRIEELVKLNSTIHDEQCFNLNPAANVMNPRAEALLSSGLGSRPSLGYPGDKYEMGLEAIEEIETIAAELCCKVFASDFAELRVVSGAMSNLYAFMATCKPGDSIITPPASIGGHVTHHEAGAAGLYGLRSLAAPVDPQTYNVDLEALADMARREKPKLITTGGSLNLTHQPVSELRKIADEVGAWLLFDAAHLSGMIAGKAWPNPLSEGAHLMTMSSYKSLGGPAGAIIVTNDDELAKRLDVIAFPGLTANFDAAKTAALAVSMLDWINHGEAYAAAMRDVANAFVAELCKNDMPVFGGGSFDGSHQFALEAAAFGGGHAASKHLRKAGILVSGIGLPTDPVEGDMNGIRFGTPEIVRRGVTVTDAPRIAAIISKALKSDNPESLAGETTELRAEFSGLHFVG